MQFVTSQTFPPEHNLLETMASRPWGTPVSSEYHSSTVTFVLCGSFYGSLLPTGIQNLKGKVWGAAYYAAEQGERFTIPKHLWAFVRGSTDKAT